MVQRFQPKASNQCASPPTLRCRYALNWTNGPNVQYAKIQTVPSLPLTCALPSVRADVSNRFVEVVQLPLISLFGQLGPVFCLCFGYQSIKLPKCPPYSFIVLYKVNRSPESFPYENQRRNATTSTKLQATSEQNTVLSSSRLHGTAIGLGAWQAMLQFPWRQRPSAGCSQKRKKTCKKYRAIPSSTQDAPLCVG